MGIVSGLFPSLAIIALALGAGDSHAGERWSQYTSFTYITRMVDGGPVLWLATSGGLIRLNKASGEKTYFNQAQSAFTDSRISSLASDEAGRVWVATQGGSLAEFDGKTWSNLGVHPALAGMLILDLAWDFRGSVWVLAVDRGSRKPAVFRRQDGQWTRLYLEGADTMPLSSLGYGYGSGYGYGYGFYSVYQHPPSYLQTDGAGQAWVVIQSGNRARTYRISPSGRVDTTETPHHLTPRWFLVPRSGSPFWLCARHLAKPAATGWDTVSYPAGIQPQIVSHPGNVFARTADGGLLLSLNRLIKYREGGWENVSVPEDSLERFPLLLESEAGDACPLGDCFRAAGGDRVGSPSGDAWTFVRTASTPVINTRLDVLRARGAGSPDLLLGTSQGVQIFRPATSQVTPVDFGSAWDPSQAIYSMGEDHRGNLWVRGHRNLYRVAADWIRNFTPENSPLAGSSDYLPAAEFLAVDARKVVWVADSGQLISIPDGSGDTSAWKRHRLPADPRWEGVNVNALAVHTDGSLWFSGRAYPIDQTAHGLIGRYDGRSWRMFGGSHHAWLDSLLIQDLRCDGNGHVWALMGAGLLQWDGTAWKEHARTPSSPLRTGIQALAVDPEGRLWAATAPPEAALLRWNDRWETVPGSREKLATSPMRSMTFDAAGRLWMAMTWDGVLVHDPSGTEPTGLSSARRPAPYLPPSLSRRADGLWRLSPGALAGAGAVHLRILDLRGTEVPGTDDELRPSPAGEWIWPGPGRRLPPGRYLLSLRGRQGRQTLLPFLYGIGPGRP